MPKPAPQGLGRSCAAASLRHLQHRDVAQVIALLPSSFRAAPPTSCRAFPREAPVCFPLPAVPSMGLPSTGPPGYGFRSRPQVLAEPGRILQPVPGKGPCSAAGAAGPQLTWSELPATPQTSRELLPDFWGENGTILTSPLTSSFF